MNNTATAPWYRTLPGWQLVFLILMLVTASFSIAISQISLGLVLAVMLYRGIGLRQWPARTGVEWPAAALALWALGMIPLSSDVSQSLVYYRRFFLFAALWGAATLATTERRRALLLAAVVLGAVGVSVVGEIQVARAAGGLFARRFWGAGFNPMTSGAMMMLVVLPVLAFLGAGRLAWRWRAGLAVALAPLLLALLLTMTRSALLGTITGIGAMILLARPRAFLVFLLVLVILLGAVYTGGEAVLSPRYWSRLNPEYILHGQNTEARLEMWRGGWEMVKAHPWTGLGDCDLAALAPAYYGDEDTVYFGHLHSNSVMLAAIWGVPGFILAQIFIFAPLVILVRRWRELARLQARPPLQAAWVLGAVGIWAGFLVAGFTEWYFGDAEPMLLYLAILGIGLGQNTQPKEQP